MDITVRSYLRAGVALAGASMIAVAPTVAPPPMTVATPPITSVPVNLSAAVNPITAWVDVFAGAAENLGGLGNAWLQDPAPLLRQVLDNMLGYGGTVVTAVGGVVDGTLQYLDFSNEFGLWAQLGNAVEQLFQGEIAAAFNSLSDALVTGPIFNIGFPIFTSGVLDVPTKVTQNVANLVKTLLNLETMLPLVLGAVAPVMGSLAATGETLQSAFDSLAEGKLIDAVTNLINLPAAVIGAALNGYTKFDGTWMPGIFSFNEDPFQGGLLQTLFMTLPKTLAAAITPEAVPESAADAVSDPAVGGGTMVALAAVQTEEAAAGTGTVTESEAVAESAPAAPTAPEEPAAAAVDSPEEEIAGDPSTDDSTAAEDTVVPAPEETDDTETVDTEETSDDDADSGDTSDSGSTTDSGTDSDGGSDGGSSGGDE